MTAPDALTLAASIGGPGVVSWILYSWQRRIAAADSAREKRDEKTEATIEALRTQLTERATETRNVLLAIEAVRTGVSEIRVELGRQQEGRERLAAHVAEMDVRLARIEERQRMSA
jgi:septal ring factor EnvC (AmiA/AmiB activator)